MLVSIVMPAYNCGIYLEDSLNSVRSQTYEQWELIIVDDCSTDDTPSVIKRFCDMDSRIHYEKLEKNSGAAKARTRALELAKGRYIAFLDADDLWHPEKLERQIAFMQENNIVFSATAYEQIDENGCRLGKILTPPTVTDEKKLFYLADPLGNLTVMYDQQTVGRLIVPDVRKRNDYALWFEVFKHTPYCMGMPDVLAYYRIRSDSISHNKWKLVKHQWHLYHHVEKFSLLKSGIGILCWGAVKSLKIGMTRYDVADKTKLAIVLPCFRGGGAEHMVAHMVSNLDQNVFQPEVFCINGLSLGSEMEAELTAAGIPIHYMEKKNGFSVKTLWRLGRELSAFAPKVLHTHQNGIVYTFPWRLLHRKVKSLHTLHTLPEKENKRVIRRWISRFLFQSGSTVPVAVSKENQKLIMDYYALSENQVPVVYNPVATDQYYHDAKVMDEYVFVTVGRLTLLKNQQLLIDAVKQLKDEGVEQIRLWLVGTGELESKLKAYVKLKNLEEQVVFWGYQKNVPDILAQADAFVLSSQYEGLPLCILEAMAAGLPIISTAVGGIGDAVKDCGILISPGSVQEMAASMKRLIQNPEQSKLYADNAIQAVKTFDVKHCAKAYEELYLK